MSLNEIAISIQDKWLIEEKAIIFRRNIKFNPPRAPTRAEKIAEIITSLFKTLEIIKYETKVKGAIFWTVDSKYTWGHVSPSITWGNQKWNGALPIFNNKENKIKVILKKVKEKDKNLDEIKRAEPKAWIRKYLRAASEK